MTYVHILVYTSAAAGGVVLGLIYFVGLWITVKKAQSIRRPYLFLMGSFFIRTVFVLAGFYLLLLYNWTYLVTAMLAFIVTRQWVLQQKGKPSDLLYG